MARSILVCSWFAKQLAAAASDLIGANDQRIGIICGDVQSFAAGKPQRQRLRQFSRERSFVDLRRCNLKGQAKPGQEIPSVTRGGGEDEFHESE